MVGENHLQQHEIIPTVGETFQQYGEHIPTVGETFKISTVGETIRMQDYVEYAIQTSRERRKYMKEASDNKSEENRPPFKLNFNGGQLSSLLLSEASFMYFWRSSLF